MIQTIKGSETVQKKKKKRKKEVKKKKKYDINIAGTNNRPRILMLIWSVAWMAI